MLLAACTSSTSGPAGPSQQRGSDGSAYEACDSLCLRPGDCQMAYNDDGICPAGFRCALRFQCSPSPTPSPSP